MPEPTESSAMTPEQIAGGSDAEEWARRFHETYERLAPAHGYETREASAKPWEEVPERNRALMVATVGAVLHDLLAHIKVLTDELAAKTEVAKSNKRVVESYAEEVERVTRERDEARQALDHQRERFERELAQTRVNWNAEARRFVDEIEQLRQHGGLARAAGYAEAIAILRDDSRYASWWTRILEKDPAHGYWQEPARRHLADYLETIALPLPSGNTPIESPALDVALHEAQAAAARHHRCSGCGAIGPLRHEGSSYICTECNSPPVESPAAEPEHAFDEGSVLNPVTGKPYGPGPLWAGTEPMDYPDPTCVCGALWDDERGGCQDAAPSVDGEDEVPNA